VVLTLWRGLLLLHLIH